MQSYPHIHAPHSSLPSAFMSQTLLHHLSSVPISGFFHVSTTERSLTEVIIDTKGSKPLPHTIWQLPPHLRSRRFPTIFPLLQPCLPLCPLLLSTAVHLVCSHRWNCVIPQTFHLFWGSVPTPSPGFSEQASTVKSVSVPSFLQGPHFQDCRSQSVSWRHYALSLLLPLVLSCSSMPLTLMPLFCLWRF